MTEPQQPGWPGTPPSAPSGWPGTTPGYGPPPQPGQLPPAYGYPVAPQTDGTAIAVLVLAICSFVVFPVVPAIVALVIAPGAERSIAESGGRLTGDGLVRAGRIVAWIHLVLCLLLVLLLVLVFGALGAATFSA